MSISGPFPKTQEIALDGTEGAKLKVVLVPTASGQPKLENVNIEACYTEGIICELF